MNMEYLRGVIHVCHRNEIGSPSLSIPSPIIPYYLPAENLYSNIRRKREKGGRARLVSALRKVGGCERAGIGQARIKNNGPEGAVCASKDLPLAMMPFWPGLALGLGGHEHGWTLTPNLWSPADMTDGLTHTHTHRHRHNAHTLFLNTRNDIGEEIAFFVPVFLCSRFVFHA